MKPNTSLCKKCGFPLVRCRLLPNYSYCLTQGCPALCYPKLYPKNPPDKPRERTRYTIEIEDISNGEL